MKLKNARELRDVIRADGTYCTVPNGHGPDRYFVSITTSIYGNPAREIRLVTIKEYERYKMDRFKLKLKSRPRSPIEYMVDKACGLS